MHYSQQDHEKVFTYGKNSSWKGVLKSWPIVKKNFICEYGISDRSFHCENFNRNIELTGGKSLPIQNH